MLISNAGHILPLSTCVISTSHTSRIYMRIIRLSSMPLVAFVVPTTRFRFRPARATTDRPLPPEPARTLAETSVTPCHVNRSTRRKISPARSVVSLTGSLADPTTQRRPTKSKRIGAARVKCNNKRATRKRKAKSRYIEGLIRNDVLY